MIKTIIERFNAKYVVSTVKIDSTIKLVDVLLGNGYDEGIKYETMIFPIVDGKPLYDELHVERYMTEEGAKEGHAKLVETWYLPN